MKLTKVLSVAPFIMLAAACSDDRPQPGDSSEAYLRAFVKEFGVPASGHDFSMARSAGLKVKASRPTHITVTAEYEGEEYLFGDLSVRPGTTDIPVTIPSEISTLNINIGCHKYTVPADGMVDIDNLTETYQDSRNIDIIGSKKGPGKIVMSNDNDRPYIAFKFSDFLDEYFSTHPVDADHPEFDYETENSESGGVPLCDTQIGTNPFEDSEYEYYVFPVYWRDSQSGHHDYNVSLAPSDGYESNSLTIFNGYYTNKKIPFPYLRHTSGISSVYDIDLSEYETAYTIANNEQNAAFDFDSDDMIVSRGEKLTFSGEHFMTYFVLASSSGLNGSSPAFNGKYWNGNYYPTTLDDLAFSLGGTRRYRVPGDYVIYENGQPRKIDGEFAFLLCFNTPPQHPNETTFIRNYADVILLVVPVQKYYLQYEWTHPKYQSFYWSIFAEDLGGSYDWDFNDAVFRFKDVIESLASVNWDNSLVQSYGAATDAVPVRKITVEPLAAGGTMPLYITYTGKVSTIPDMPSEGQIDYYTANEAIRKHLNSPREGTYIIGTEIHKWLGGTTYTKQLNTGDKVELEPGQQISFAIPTDTKPEDYRVTGTGFGVSDKNSPLMGFGVLVDKDNSLNIDTRNDNGFVELPGYKLGKGSYLLGKVDSNNTSAAPQMLLVHGQNVIEWPKECVSINEAYPTFNYWVTTGMGAYWPIDKRHEKVTCSH